MRGGKVTETVQSVNDFTLPSDKGGEPYLVVLQDANRYRKFSDNPDAKLKHQKSVTKDVTCMDCRNKNL